MKLLIAFIIICYIMPIQVIENKTWLDYCNSQGQAHLGFIILVNTEATDKARVIRHEKIHLQQQEELGIIGFYILYGADYLYNLYYVHNNFICSDKDARAWAYRNIILEVEAKKNENKIDYNRDFYDFF